MGIRRLLPLALAVVGLLGLAALASHGRPLTTSRGNGPTAGFFDYVLTTVVLVAVAIAVVAVVAASTTRASRARPQPRKWNVLGLLVSFVACVVIAILLAHDHVWLQHLLHGRLAGKGQAAKGQGATQPTPARARNAHLRWDEVAIVAALLAALGVAGFAARRPRTPRAWPLRSHEEVALAVDESLDDLRTEPDLRKAIIAAYARMERALAVAGIPRRVSEAPLEYLARALYALDASAPAITRLTDLFERAKFSQHDPDPSMRDEAIDALVAIRDELRRPVKVAA
jgi:Domain of unknown function (DUF4129)